MAALREVEGGVPIAEVLGKLGISRGALFVSKSKYGGATVAELKRLHELEAASAELRRMYAELVLEDAVIKDDVHPIEGHRSRPVEASGR